MNIYWILYSFINYISHNMRNIIILLHIFLIIVIRAHLRIGLLIRVVAHCRVNGLNIFRQGSSGYQGRLVVPQFTSQNYNRSRKIQNGAQIRTYFTSPIRMLPRFYFYSYFWWFCENFCTFCFWSVHCICSRIQLTGSWWIMAKRSL